MKTCFIVDDEAHAIEVLARYVQKTPGLDLIGSEENPLLALEAISSGRVSPYITFVDVDMPQLSGLNLAGLISSHTHVIFTTAFPDYALQAFDKDATDYLLKPISYERFLRSIQKIPAFTSRNTVPYEEERYFFIKTETKGKLARVDFEDITHIEALQNYVKIHMGAGTPTITYLTMKEIERDLPSSMFIRVHKSFIVNKTKVRGIEGNTITLDDKSSLPLGASYRNAFLERINRKLWKSNR